MLVNQFGHYKVKGQEEPLKPRFPGDKGRFSVFSDLAPRRYFAYSIMRNMQSFAPERHRSAWAQWNEEGITLKEVEAHALTEGKSIFVSKDAKENWADSSSVVYLEGVGYYIAGYASATMSEWNVEGSTIVQFDGDPEVFVEEMARAWRETPKPVADIPAEAGSGLDGRYWKYTNGPMVKLAGDVLDTIVTRPADATFTATTLNYARNDVSLFVDWLGDDGASVVFANEPEIPDVDGSLFSFTGLIAIPEAGEVTFTSSSDDGSMVWIGGQKVIDNDGYRAAPGSAPDGTGIFMTPGLYAIEILYYNGAYTD